MNFYSGDNLLRLGRFCDFRRYCLIGNQLQNDELQDFSIQNMEQYKPLKLKILFRHFKVRFLRILSGKFESNKQKLGIKLSYLKIPGITMGEKDKKGNVISNYRETILIYPVRETI